jgi:hypothetical protein
MELKTTSFRLTEDSFGDVFMYKLEPRFKDAWLRLKDAWQRLPEGRWRGLPHASLRTALTVLSGDFVTLDAEKWRAKDEDWLFFSRKEISSGDMRLALRAWEYKVWPEGAKGELAKGVVKLSVKKVSIADKLGRRPGQCPRACASQ